MKANILIHSVSLISLFMASSIAAAGQSLNGLITNNKNEIVSGALVSIHRCSDSSQVVLGFTDDKGRYTINTGIALPILIRVEAAGYATLWQHCTKAENNIRLQADHTLSEVNFSTRKAVIEQKADRTIFNVENSASTTGGDAFTTLKKTPGVQIIQSQINIAGKGGVTVTLNGRLQKLTGDELIQFLHSIPSDNISKIEVITAPGAKYDAEGDNGIINIVTKKNLKEGMRGNATVACTRTHYFSPSANASLMYRRGKLNTYITANTSTWNWLYTNRANIYYDTEHWFQKVDQEYSNKNHAIQVGADYAIGKRSQIGITYIKGFGGSDNKEHIRTDIYGNSNLPDSTMRTEGNTHEVFKGKHTLNINYEWKIDTTGKKFNIDLDYFTQQTDRNRNFGVTNYVGDELTSKIPSQNQILSHTGLSISSVKADLDLPYKSIHFTLGGKASLVNNEGAFAYYTNTQEGYKADSGRSNRFLYDESIQALYINAQKMLNKWDVQVGLRLEHTWNKGYTPSTGQINVRDYTNLFPSVKLLYKLSEKRSLAFTYQRRINRPGYSLLNPFRFYYSDNSYSAGNLQLQPSFVHSMDMSYFFGAGHFVRFRTNLIRNYWDRLYFVDSIAHVTSLTRANTGNSVYYSLVYGFNFTLAKWWDMTGTIGTEYMRFRMTAYGQERFFDGIGGWIDIGNSFYLNKKKTLLVDFHGYYYTPRQKDYKRWEEMSMFDGGIKALFFKSNLIAGLSFEDPFAKAYWQQTNKVNGTTEYSYDDGRLITLSITIKFGNNNLKWHKDKTDNSEEIQRAK